MQARTTVVQFDLDAFLKIQLRSIRQQGLYRYRSTLESAQGIEVISDHRKLVNFSSNDYLGLANHPVIVSALRDAVNNWGIGSGAAHLICGHSLPHRQLEEELAEFMGAERALLYSTGYMANLGVISSLVGKGDRVLEDRLNHASLIDGALLCRAKFRRYRHSDLAHLQRISETGHYVKQMLVTDGVFSMDGDLAPLCGIVEFIRGKKFYSMIDDAHGIGVLGANGRGTLEHFGLDPSDVTALVGTLGKAFGTFGAFVIGSESLIESLIQTSRTYIFTTALPPAIAEATRASLKLVQSESWRRDKLCSLIRQFRSGALQVGLRLSDSMTPIQPVNMGSNEEALHMMAKLKSQGFLITAIRPPTVPVGTARLRITLSSSHQESHVNMLLDAFDTILNANG